MKQLERNVVLDKQASVERQVMVMTSLNTTLGGGWGGLENHFQTSLTFVQTTLVKSKSYALNRFVDDAKRKETWPTQVCPLSMELVKIPPPPPFHKEKKNTEWGSCDICFHASLLKHIRPGGPVADQRLSSKRYNWSVVSRFTLRPQ